MERRWTDTYIMQIKLWSEWVKYDWKRKKSWQMALLSTRQIIIWLDGISQLCRGGGLLIVSHLRCVTTSENISSSHTLVIVWTLCFCLHSGLGQDLAQQLPALRVSIIDCIGLAYQTFWQELKSFIKHEWNRCRVQRTLLLFNNIIVQLTKHL